VTTPHTPRPWHQQGPFVLDADERVVCMTYNDYDRSRVRLIAAAPKLLAALERVETWMQITVELNGLHGTDCDVLDAVRAALAEARGEG